MRESRERERRGEVMNGKLLMFCLSRDGGRRGGDAAYIGEKAKSAGAYDAQHSTGEAYAGLDLKRHTYRPYIDHHHTLLHTHTHHVRYTL